MSPLFTHPLVLGLWSAAIATAAIFGWLTLSNVLVYRVARRRELLVYIAFTAFGACEALTVAAGFLPTTPFLKAAMFRLMWVFGAGGMALWMWSVLTFLELSSKLVVFARNGLFVVAIIPLLDLVVSCITDWSLLYAMVPAETRSIALQASGNPMRHKPLADILGLVLVLLVFISSLVMLRLVRRRYPEERALLVGIVVTGACISAEALLAGTDSRFNLPFMFLGNLIEALRISWVSRERLFQEIDDIRRAQQEQAALISHQLEQIKFKARMAMLGEHTVQLTHDLRNPLTSVLGGLDLAEMELKDLGEGGARAREVLELTRASTEHILALVRRITQQARNETQESARQVEVNAIVESAGALCDHMLREIRFESDVPEGVQVIGKPTELTQVLVNLIANAARVVAAQGEPWVKISARTGPRYLTLRITDSGRRPKDDVLDKMFSTRFTTAKPGEGTGLGLTICSRIITQHGGRIYVDRVAPNTTVVVELPLGRPPLAA